LPWELEKRKVGVCGSHIVDPGAERVQMFWVE